MEVLLKSYDNANEYLSRSTLERVLLPIGQKSSGWFKIINGSPCMLVIQDGLIFLEYAGVKEKIDSEVSAETIDLEESSSQFLLSRGGEIKIKFSYENDKHTYGVEPFDYIDEEDFDWGLFLSNIINNSSRQNSLIKNLSD